MSSTQPADAPSGEPATAAANKDEALASYREELRAVVAGDRPASLPLRLGAEALGTFALVLVTIGAALYGRLGGQGVLGTALGAGLVLAGVTAALWRVSGGHFNPAVTLGSAIGGRTSWADLPMYWIAQLVGGAVAAAVLFVSIPATLAQALQLQDTKALMSTTANGWDEHSPLYGLSQGQVTFDLKAVLVLELVASIVLVAVWLGSTSRRASRAAAPVAIGLTYAALILLVAPLTGGGLNPARSTAAAIFSESWAFGQLWLFWVAPLVGAAIAGLAYLAFATPSVDEEIAALAALEDGDDEDDDLDGSGGGNDEEDDGSEEHIVVEPR